MSTHGVLAGLSISLTGCYARQGRQALDGLLLWQSYMNAQGGAGPVRLIHYDDQSRPGLARANTLRLLQQDRVDVLFGPYSSSLTLVAVEVAEEHKKVLWNHGGSSDEIFRRGYRFLVSTASPASDYLRTLPLWLVKHAPGLRRICVCHSGRGTFARHVARGVLEGAQSVGMHSVELVLMGSPLPEAEALVLAASFEEEVQMLRKRHLWPRTIQLVAAVGAGVQAFYEQVQQASEGVIGPSQWEPQARFAEAQGPDSDWFVRNFQERSGRVPEYTAAGSFAIGLIAAECMRRAGSLEDEALREAAARLDCHTFYGGFRLDPGTGRQIGHRILLAQWQHGRKVLLDFA